MARSAAPKAEAAPATAAEKTARRKIPGGLPYTSSAGVLRRVLGKIPTSEKPSIFTSDFLGTVLNATGGAARPIIPILKSTGMLNQNGSPTELYSQFQTESGRPTAALQALRNGYGEIFKRNTYAHKADEAALTDVIVQVTGLPGTDQIVRYIYSTFQAFQELAKGAKEAQGDEAAGDGRTGGDDNDGVSERSPEVRNGKLNLAYNINVVLPETTNVEVYNAIFRSIKGNLLG
jgi:Family of unknown function (DUF5343)